ncbi:MAG TPA: hypothetical protein VE842_10570, partial [Pyrinomonadaceae bacterium]|nr:hypothetical protein [Pyrinomonadaceae bacterium]
MSEKRRGAETRGGAKRRAKSSAASRSAASTASVPAPPAESEISYPTVPAHELRRLLGFKHPDPHSVLGVHPSREGAIVRAYRPEAQSVELLIGRERPRPMTRSHAAGLFELLVRDRTEAFPYRLRVTYADGNTFTQRDPYAFLPTLTDLDEHLFNEGRHERIYEKLGAHVRSLDGVKGVSFAVWAPHAAGVSVVGLFNNWDGRLHQMRRLGVSGIWEIFIPDLGPGELYKYEIRTHAGLPFLKSDPYAFYTEVPPVTSSIVHEPTYRFRDADWMERRARVDHQRRPLSIYEVHHGSWRRVAQEAERPLKYREMAPALARYVREMGFTHVEFLPLKEHP